MKNNTIDPSLNSLILLPTLNSEELAGPSAQLSERIEDIRLEVNKLSGLDLLALEVCDYSDLESQVEGIQREIIALKSFDNELEALDQEILKIKESIDAKICYICNNLYKLERFLENKGIIFVPLPYQDMDSYEGIVEEAMQHYASHLDEEEMETGQVESRISKIKSRVAQLTKFQAKAKVLQAQREQLVANGPEIDNSQELQDMSLSQYMQQLIDNKRAISLQAVQTARAEQAQKEAIEATLRTERLEVLKQATFRGLAIALVVLYISYKQINREIQFNQVNTRPQAVDAQPKTEQSLQYPLSEQISDVELEYLFEIAGEHGLDRLQRLLLSKRVLDDMKKYDTKYKVHRENAFPKNIKDYADFLKKSNLLIPSNKAKLELFQAPGSGFFIFQTADGALFAEEGPYRTVLGSWMPSAGEIHVNTVGVNQAEVRRERVFFLRSN